ncbi:MAG: hypothetical protein H7Z13_06645 [Ferruginibacter sp.]|nr:hypothetical protein [Ferruginibacter sp.]
MKKIFTKKLWLVTLLFSATNLLNAQQLLVQNFNFSGNVSANGWIAHSGAATNAIATTTGLTYTGLPVSGIGNAALVSNLSGEDDNITFTNQTTDGQSVYFSCMVNVTEVSTTKSGDYFLHIGSGGGASFTTFAARVFVKTTATGINFGISNTATPTYGTTNFALNTTYLLIVKYTISVAGNDPVSLWIIPSGVPASEAAAGTPELVNTTTAGQNTISAIALRQGSSTTSVQTVVDGLVVGLTWSDVTTGGTLPIFLQYLNGQKTSTGIALNWKVTCLSTNIVMEMERAADSRNFIPVTTIEATQARCNLPFDFTDALPLKGKNYYRLKMRDIDGKISYSPVVLIINGSKGIEFVGLYPSMVKNETALSISSARATTIETKITDINGRLIKTGKQTIPTGSSLITINCTNLAPGIYNLTGIAEDATAKTIRFVKL